MNDPSQSPPLRPWLQLLRLPNLVTVPGDPLAGCFLAAGGRGINVPAAVLAVSSSLCLYAAGLVLNDLADLETDRRERPSRPLPSGRIEPGHARALLGVLLAASIVLLWMLNGAARGIGAALIAFVFLYNLVLKKNRFAGPAGMGVCRGLSLLLGAASAGGLSFAPVWAAALVLTAAIAALTAWSRNEARVAGRPGRVGLLLSLLVPAKALLVLLSRHPASIPVAVALLVLWPVNRIMGRIAYSS